MVLANSICESFKVAPLLDDDINMLYVAKKRGKKR